jgi:hypothetical protein
VSRYSTPLAYLALLAGHGERLAWRQYIPMAAHTYGCSPGAILPPAPIAAASPQIVPGAFGS